MAESKHFMDQEAARPLSIKERIIDRIKHPGFQRYFKNTSWSLGAKVLSLGFSFLVSTYVARYLGPTNYGQLSYAVSFVGIFSFIATLGIDSILYRDLIKHPHNVNEYMGSALGLKLGSGILAAIICVGSAFFFSSADVSIVLILIISLSYVFTAWNIIIYEFQMHVEQKYPSIISLAVTIILNILKLIVVFYNQGIIYFALILLVEAILYAILYIHYRQKKYGSITQWRFKTDVAVSIIKDAWPLMIITTFTLIYTRIDQVMIKSLIDSTAVGHYDAAVRIAEAWNFVPAIIASSLFPAIVNAKKTSAYIYKKRVIYLIFGLTALAVVISLPVALLSSFIMKLLYGTAYLEGASVLSIYMWAGVWTSIGLIVQYYLINENKKKMLFIISLFAMVLNIVLNIYLIPRFGINGAAWATFISYAVLTLPVISIFKMNSNDTNHATE